MYFRVCMNPQQDDQNGIVIRRLVFDLYFSSWLENYNNEFYF